MFFIFLGFIAVLTSKVLEAREGEREKIAEDLATMVRNEVDLAKSVSDGYTRTFNIPNKLEGSDYNIEIIDNRELVVNYIDKEYVLFLPEKICGDLFIPDNEIDKEKGIVCVNSNLDYTQCESADCGTLDLGTKCCCCERYSFCC